MINWKLRLKNKTTLITLIIAMVSLVYMGVGLVGFVPRIAQEEIVNLLMLGVNILAILGIVVDPTTKGIGDSQNALNYDNPQ